MACSSPFARITLASLVSLALCTGAWAQPGPGGAPKPGGTGPGGRGPGGAPPFGMMGPGLGGATFSVSSQYARLVTMPTVQKELELTDDQKAEIKQAGEKAQESMRSLFADMRDLSEEERREKMQEIGKKMQAQAQQTQKAIQSVLLPMQLERLKGIALQVMGVQALNDKEIQQDLKLTQEQIAKIKSIGEDAAKKMRQMFTPGGDPQSFGTKMQEIRKESEKQIMAVLTDDQKAALDDLKGDKLDIPASELRGPGGPGGPGGFGRPGTQGGPGPGGFGPGGDTGERRRPPARKTDE